MATESPQQTTICTQVTDKKKGQVHCMGCNDTLHPDHTGIVCVGDHHICTECSKAYINEVFEDPAKYLPLKCMICKADIIAETFERQLNGLESQTILLYNMKYNPKSFLAENEIVVACPFCGYFEINTNDAGRLLFLCKRDNCMKSSCVWCKKVIKDHKHCDSSFGDDIFDDDDDDIFDDDSDSDDEKYDIDQEDVESHFECAQLAPFKQKWDKSLSDGNTLQCPKCGISGRKNNACTHITCVKCKTLWCYCCGLGVDKLDKSGDLDNIGAHNIHWKTNPKRCPMYLDNIREVDERWPEDDSQACVTFLHRLRTMQLLKSVIQELGDAAFAALCEKYNVDKICGFDMKETMEGDHRLIIRNDHIAYSDSDSDYDYDSDSDSDDDDDDGVELDWYIDDDESED